MQHTRLGLTLGLLLFLCGCGGGSQSAPPPAALVSIQVTGGSANLTAGQTQQLKAIGSYSNNSTQDLTATATWISSDTTIATVAPGGMLNAKNSGTCSISAKMGSVTGGFNLSVAPGLVSISIAPSTISVAPGTTAQFIATGTYSDNSTQNLTNSVTWASSDSSIVTVSSTSPTAGLAKAVANGTATVTAVLGSISGAADVTVTSASATSIVVSPTNVSLPLGLHQQFTANATFSDGTNQDITGVATWKSSSGTVASITTSGLATARNVGTINISAIFGGVSDSTPLTINAANLSSISIQPRNATIAEGTRIQLAAIGTFNDGGTRDITHQANWSSSDPTVVAIGALNGSTFGLAPGLVTITAALGSASDSVSLNVTSAKIVSISLAPASTTIPVGGHAHLVATGVFEDSSTQDISMSSVWTSSNTAVATVGSSSGTYGSVTGVSSGVSNINATFNYAGASTTGSSQTTVSGATLVSIAVTPSSALAAPASGQQFTAMGTFSDGSKQSINGSVNWSSSDPTVATINSTGAAIGQSPGVVTITAKTGSLSASASLVVESSALSSIQILPQSVSIPASTQAQFKATGTFANGDAQDLTSSVMWTSSSSGIATLSNSSGSIGLATGVSPGTVTVSGIFNGQVGTATLIVTNATLTSIAVSPATATINLGGSQQFTAKGTFSDGSVAGITNQVSWTSSNPAIATVTAIGAANGASAGTSTISASMNGVTGTAILTVQ
jgi:uncharacterized protein YjdB